MPKPQLKLAINLNLLKPQSNPEKLPIKLFRWLLLSGRYIFVLVEALVLVAFAVRFKLDADIAAKKEAIDEQIPYIESLKPYEILIRQTQLKLATIDTIKTTSLDWSMIFQKIADQVPVSIKILAVNLTKDVNTTTIHITGQTPLNSDITNFILGLRDDGTLQNVNLVSIGLEEGIIKFTIDATANLISTGDKNL